MAWTEESIEILKAGWADGLSASQIALRLSGMSRNAVIGKAVRLGLEGRAQPSDPSRGRVDGAVALGNAALDRIPDDFDEPLVSTNDRPTVETIRSGQCRWPMGDPVSENFHFCGEPTTGRVYCAHHVSRAYQRQAPSRRTVMDEIVARRAKRRACVTGADTG